MPKSLLTAGRRMSCMSREGARPFQVYYRGSQPTDSWGDRRFRPVVIPARIRVVSFDPQNSESS